MIFCEEEPAPSELVYLDTLEGEHDFLLEEDGARLVLESDTSKLVFEGVRVGRAGWDAVGCLCWVGRMDRLIWMGLPGPDGGGEWLSFVVGYACQVWGRVVKVV